VADIPDRALRSALEFAVDIAAAGQRRTPKLAIPDGLRPFLRLDRLPAKSLAAVRAAVEGDDTFRAALGTGVQPGLVDDIGRLWLQRPPEWEASIEALLQQQEQARADDADSARRERRRREAAEAALARVRDELQHATAELERLRGELDHERRIAESARSESADLRRRLSESERHAQRLTGERDRAIAARDQAQAEQRAAAIAEAEAVAARDHALLRRQHDDDAVVDVVATVQRLHQQQRLAQATLDELLAAVNPPSQTRVRVRIPGGVRGDARAEAEVLLRADTEVLVDGYNVAKTVWPDESLADQRERCLSLCEQLARRFGASIAVVFDGADVPGASAPRRVISVEYSPAGVSADDVLRDRVRRLPARRAVVVVTDDQAIVRDVQALGAHVVPSRVFAALAR
jgi:hypothetical protein